MRPESHKRTAIRLRRAADWVISPGALSIGQVNGIRIVCRDCARSCGGCGVERQKIARCYLRRCSAMLPYGGERLAIRPLVQDGTHGVYFGSQFIRAIDLHHPKSVNYREAF